MKKSYEFDHLMEDRTPFTYLIGWKKLNVWYYGRRTAKGCHPNDLWKTYFTSSKVVKNFTKIHGEPDIVKIHMIFNDVTQCCIQEELYLKTNDAKNNGHFLNQTNSGVITEKDHLTNKAKAYIDGAYIGLVSTSDYRWKTGEIHGSNKGKKLNHGSKISKTTTGRKGKSCSEETRIKLSNKLKGIPTKNKNQVTVRSLISGDCFNVTTEIFNKHNNILFVSIKSGTRGNIGKLNVFDLITNNFICVSKDEYYKYKDIKYITSTAAKKRGLI